MDILIINLFLALLWAALTGVFTLQNLITGFLLGYFILYLLRGVFNSKQYFYKGNQVLRFILTFLWELLAANLRVARDVLRPGLLRMKPRVVAVPLDLRGDTPVTLLASVVSLTPGSLSLDVSDDHKTLFIHSIYAPDAEMARQEVKQGFERLVAGLFSQSLPARAPEEKP